MNHDDFAVETAAMSDAAPSAFPVELAGWIEEAFTESFITRRDEDVTHVSLHGSATR